MGKVDVWQDKIKRKKHCPVCDKNYSHRILINAIERGWISTKLKLMKGCHGILVQLGSQGNVSRTLILMNIQKIDDRLQSRVECQVTGKLGQVRE